MQGFLCIYFLQFANLSIDKIVNICYISIREREKEKKEGGDKMEEKVEDLEKRVEILETQIQMLLKALEQAKKEQKDNR